MTRSTTTVLFLIALTSVSLQGGIKWKYCPGSDGSQLSIDEVDINPFPLKRGKKALFEILGDAKVDIAQKDIALDVYRVNSGKPAKVYTTKIGGAYHAAKGSDFDYQTSYGLPLIVPPGVYFLHLNIVDSSGHIYTCFQFEVDF